MLRATLLAVLAGAFLQLESVQARPADPIPPVAPWLSDAEALALLPAAVRSRSTKQLVLHRYSHLNAGAPAGSYDRGEIIGLCGNTGRWSTGPHLHFEAEPLHLLDVLESPRAEQLKSMEQMPQWRQRSVEASR